jgi:hypothetical protein
LNSTVGLDVDNISNPVKLSVDFPIIISVLRHLLVLSHVGRQLDHTLLPEVSAEGIAGARSETYRNESARTSGEELRGAYTSWMSHFSCIERFLGGEELPDLVHPLVSDNKKQLALRFEVDEKFRGIGSGRLKRDILVNSEHQIWYFALRAQ